MSVEAEFPSSPDDLIDEAAKYFGPPSLGEEDEMWRDVRDYLQDRKGRLEEAPSGGLGRYRFAIRENRRGVATGVGLGLAGKSLLGLGLLDFTSANSDPEYVFAGVGVLAGIAGMGMGYEKVKEVKSFAANIDEQAESYGRAIETIEEELQD